MTTSLIVTVANKDEDGGSGSAETQVFRASPVLVGSGLQCGLRLADCRVAPRQGLLFFTPWFVRYLDCSNAGGGAGGPPVIIGLGPESAIGIGPFQISARLLGGVDSAHGMAGPAGYADVPLLLEEVGSVFTTVGLAARAFRNGGDFRALPWFMTRVLEVLNVVSSAFFEIRGPTDGLWGQREDQALSTPPAHAWDSLDIADYLLAGDRTDAWLDDLRSYFIDLTRFRRPRGPPIAQA